MKKALLLVGIIATTLSTSAFASTYNTKINSFKTRADIIIKEVNNFQASGTYQDMFKKYRDIDLKIDTLDNDMDYYENTLERDYRAGKLNYNSFISLDRQLETIEYSFEDLDDVLEYKIRMSNTQSPNYNNTPTSPNYNNAPYSQENYYDDDYYYGNGYYDFDDYYDDDDFDDYYDDDYFWGYDD